MLWLIRANKRVNRHGHTIVPLAFSYSVPNNVRQYGAPFSPMTPLPTTDIERGVVHRAVRVRRRVTRFVFVHLRGNLRASIGAALNSFCAHWEPTSFVSIRQVSSSSL